MRYLSSIRSCLTRQRSTAIGNGHPTGHEGPPRFSCSRLLKWCVWVSALALWFCSSRLLRQTDPLPSAKRMVLELLPLNRPSAERARIDVPKPNCQTRSLCPQFHPSTKGLPAPPDLP